MDDVVLCGDPLEIVTTDPLPSSPSPRSSAARMSAMAGQVLRRNVSRSCASLMASKERGCGAPPSVLTMRSIRPNASTARQVSARTACSLSMEPATPTPRSPSDRSDASVDASRSSSRPFTTTEADGDPASDHVSERIRGRGGGSVARDPHRPIPYHPGCTRRRGWEAVPWPTKRAFWPPHMH